VFPGCGLAIKGIVASSFEVGLFWGGFRDFATDSVSCNILTLESITGILISAVAHTLLKG